MERRTSTKTQPVIFSEGPAKIQPQLLTQPRTNPPLVLLSIAFLTSLVFVGLTGVHLTAQGAFYDELHQAPAAFAYAGSRPAFFNSNIAGFPVLNMSYSGAIKSTLYGLYMKWTWSRFSLWSWRLMGILFVAGGLFVFCWTSGGTFSMAGLSLFLLLFLSDITVQLTTRHDWGPVALALALRLVMLAVWLKDGNLEKSPVPWREFLLGAIVGLSVLEKLSSVVLMIFPYLVLLLDPRFQRRRAWAGVHAGLIAGLAPLAFVNVVSFVGGEGLVSLTHTRPVEEWAGRGLDMFASHILGYLALGQGSWTRSWIFDEAPAGYMDVGEALLIIAAGIVVASLALTRGYLRDPLLRRATIALAAYGAICISIYCLPAVTYPYHWIVGTPFQYVAIGLALSAAGRMGRCGGVTMRRLALVSVVAALLVLRVPAFVETQTALWSKRYSQRFDPILTRLGTFAAQHPRSLFAAATWGTATQIYCFSQGDDRRIWEPFRYGAQFEGFMEEVNKGGWESLYLIQMETWAYGPEATARVISVVESSPAWRETEAEPQLSNPPFLVTRKFVPNTSPEIPQ